MLYEYESQGIPCMKKLQNYKVKMGQFHVDHWMFLLVKLVNLLHTLFLDVKGPENSTFGPIIK